MEKEYKIGEVFKMNGNWYECILNRETDLKCINCGDCEVDEDRICDLLICDDFLRKDNNEVKFKKLSQDITRPIGSTFIYKGDEIEVVETDYNENCENCISDSICSDNKIFTGQCMSDFRTDGKNVYFRKKEKKEMKKITLKNIKKDIKSDWLCLGRITNSLMDRNISLDEEIPEKIALDIEWKMNKKGWLKKMDI